MCVCDWCYSGVTFDCGSPLIALSSRQQNEVFVLHDILIRDIYDRFRRDLSSFKTFTYIYSLPCAYLAKLLNKINHHTSEYLWHQRFPPRAPRRSRQSWLRARIYLRLRGNSAAGHRVSSLPPSRLLTFYKLRSPEALVPGGS